MVDKSVEDVDWGDHSDGDGTETESENSVASGEDAGGKTLKPHGHSSIGETDVGLAPADAAKTAGDKKEVDKKDGDKKSFESWASKGSGEEFDEAGSADAPEAAKVTAPEAGTGQPKEEAKEGKGPAEVAAKGDLGGDGTNIQKTASDKDMEPTASDIQPTASDIQPAASLYISPVKTTAAVEGRAEEVAVQVEGGDDEDALLDDDPADLDDDAAGEASTALGGESSLVIAEDMPSDLEALGIGIGEEAAVAAAAAAGEQERAETRLGRVLQDFTARKNRYAAVFARVRDKHTKKVRCVLCPLFILMTPIFILWILYKGLRYICYQLFRNQQKEEEEADRKAAEEEEKRVAAAIAAGPQRSKLKPPVMTARFARGRQLQKHVLGEDGREEDPDGRGHKMTLREAAKDLKPTAHDKRIEEAKGQNLNALRHHKTEPRWRRMLPTRWPKYFREWWKYRTLYFKRVGALIDTIEEEEEFDWENLDEHGNPAQNKFIFPRPVRRKYRIFVLIYFDPFVELLDNWPLFVKGVKWFIRFLPLFAMLGSFAWFGYNLWLNLQYVAGNCIVDKLPEVFNTVGKIDENVEATYIVQRFYAASPTRESGHVFQECVASVPCTEMDYGDSNSYDDDRCVVFQAWKLGDKIDCFYMNNDFWGDKGTELSCLTLPSKMERETFTVAIAVVVNVLICVILGVYRWHGNDLKRQADLASAEAASAEAEEAAAKKLIEEKEQEEAMKQQEAANRQLGITEEGDDEAMGDMAAFMAAKDDEDADQQR